MAKVTIAGQAIVVTSSLKLEDIKKVAKYRKEALVLKGGEDGKEPIFKIGVTTKPEGSINANGAEFGSATHDDEQFAQITQPLNFVGDNVREGVAEAIGASILYLNKLEEKIPAVIEEINKEKESILENITIA